MTMRPHRVALIGMGKMGTAVKALAQEARWEITAEIDDDLKPEQLRGADVAIDFSIPGAAVPNILTCLDAGCPMAVGTTGWYDQMNTVRAAVARREGALFWAPNFSLGANALMLIAAQLRRLLPDDVYPAAIVETHHARKLDAPSGTALAIARGLEPTAAITSVREGDVPGTHEVTFAGPFDMIRLEHVVTDRRVFAAGALAAADWLIGKAGVFTMSDMLAAQSPPQNPRPGTVARAKEAA